MLQKNCTAALQEIAQCQPPMSTNISLLNTVCTILNLKHRQTEDVPYTAVCSAVKAKSHADIFNKKFVDLIKETFDYILNFDLSIYRKNLTYVSKKDYNKPSANFITPNIAIYTTGEKTDTDIIKIYDIMKIFND